MLAKVVGGTLVLLLAVSLVYTMISIVPGYEPFSAPGTPLVEPNQKVDIVEGYSAILEDVFSMLWTFRAIDTLLGAILLFATLAGAVAQFREEKEEIRPKEE